MTKLARIVLITLAAAAAAILFATSGGAARVHARTSPRAAKATAHHPYKATVTWKLISSGRSAGRRTTGEEGRGTFSVRLGAAADVFAWAYAALTGVPLTSIARGGTYAIKFNSAANGDHTGTLVAKFKDVKLGEACASYRSAFGKYTIGMPYVPESGSVTSSAGTGPAATWRISVTFKLTGISGISTEAFASDGKATASTGPARKMTAACRAVAELLK
jgi:hypothetical protein